MKSYQEINERIRNGDAVVLTAEEVVDVVESEGTEKAAREVDVVTTGTFGAMCSSGAFFNFGHSEPPIKMQRVWMNGVPAYTGLASVDAYLGVTQVREEDDLDYGGANVIEELVSGEAVELRAESQGTDCYPRKEIETSITLDSINQAYMYNPRNAYQNYAVATNSTENSLFTYMGKLLPNYGNATFSSAGTLSPLMNDPDCRTIGIGTRIFLCGGEGYVSWEGTQYSTDAPLHNGVPTRPSRSLAVTGDLRGMSKEFLRALRFTGYGISMAIGVGVPIPVLDEDMVRRVSITDDQILAPVLDYSVGSRNRKVLKEVPYSELRSGSFELFGKEVKTSSLSSYFKARQIADTLKGWIEEGDFQVTQPVESLSQERSNNALDIHSKEEVGI
ncbi:MAG: homocysteine biosynthesis protein [Methanomassiliicoccales archaeon]